MVPHPARKQSVERHAPAQRARVHVYGVQVLELVPARDGARCLGGVGGVEVVAGGGIVETEEAHGAGDGGGEDECLGAFLRVARGGGSFGGVGLVGVNVCADGAGISASARTV